MKERNIVKQNFNIINSRYKLNPNEIKFIMNVITQIDRDDEDFKDYTFTIKELEDKIGSDWNETRLKVFAKTLMSKPFEVREKDGWSIYNWFSKIKYKNGVFLVHIHKDLKPYLLDLKERFVTYNIHNILKLSSSYTIRIYQFLKEYENLGKRTFNIEELQDILQVPDSLKTYSNFKQRVLLPTIKEINENTDLDFWFEETKKIGKKVIEITFFIRTKKKKETYLDSLENFIKHLKKECINEDILKHKEKTLSISEEGKLYSKETLVNYTTRASKEIYEHLYALAKEGKLHILKQQKLF